MARGPTPTAFADVLALQRLKKTMAANSLAEAAAAEQKASDQHKTCERQANASLEGWSEYLSSGSLDPGHLARLRDDISQSSRAIDDAAATLKASADEVAARLRALELTDATLRQTKIAAAKAKRRRLQKEEEASDRAREERAGLSWRARQ